MSSAEEIVEFNISIAGNSNDSNLVLSSASAQINEYLTGELPISNVENKEESDKKEESDNLEGILAFQRLQSYQPHTLFRLTEAGAKAWKDNNLTSYEKYGSPEAGYIASFLTFREGPFSNGSFYGSGFNP